MPVVYEWNFPKAGLRASRIVKEVVPIIAQTCSSDPKMVIHIVVPPCQPMFGKGEAVGDERAESIAQNVDRLWGADKSFQWSLREKSCWPLGCRHLLLP